MLKEDMLMDAEDIHTESFEDDEGNIIERTYDGNKLLDLVVMNTEVKLTEEEERENNEILRATKKGNVNGVPKIIVSSPIELLKIKQWNEIEKLAREIFYNPDIEALQIILASYAAHFFKLEKPVWLMVIGPPSTGKTSLALDSLTGLQKVEAIDNLTPKSIASGYGTRNGLLPMITSKHKGDCICTMGDSGSLLGKNIYDLKEIAGIFRRIYDGVYRPIKGNQEDAPYWKGKITFIMAATEAMEKAWSVGRDLGERFVNVRWRSDDSIEGRLKAARFAGRQIGATEKIDLLFGMIKEFVDISQGNHSFKDSCVPDDIQIKLEGLATLTGSLRRIVGWGGRDDKEIVRVDDPEGSGRLTKVFTAEIMGAASLTRRKTANKNDLQLIKRIAWDSIPRIRGKIIQVLLEYDKECIGMDECDVRKLVGATRSPFDKAIKELIAINVIDRDEKAKDPGHWIILRRDILDLARFVSY